LELLPAPRGRRVRLRAHQASRDRRGLPRASPRRKDAGTRAPGPLPGYLQSARPASPSASAGPLGEVELARFDFGAAQPVPRRSRYRGGGRGVIPGPCRPEPLVLLVLAAASEAD